MLQNNLDTPSNDSDVTCSSIDDVKQLRGKLSLKLLNTLDPFIDSIINQTPFVTGYYMSSDDKWSRMGIEGFLYVVKRTQRPLYSFILINKKSENHLVEYITPEFQMNHNGNFIFYKSKDINRNSMNSLHGLWFFDQNECINTYEKLCEISNNTSPLEYNINSFDSLYDNFEDLPVVPRNQTNDTNNESNDAPIKSIGSFLLDSITNKSSNKRNDDKPQVKQLEKFNLDQDVVNNSNISGKHLMTLLKSSGKPDSSNSPLLSDSESYKMLNNMSLKSTDSPVIQHKGFHSQSLNISYDLLKSAISEVVKSDQFVSLVWDELKKRSKLP